MGVARGPYRVSTKRQASADERRQQIKAAAMTVFAEQGLDEATVGAIVGLSQVSTGTFYNYFGTKEALFDGLVEDAVGGARVATGAARHAATTLEEMVHRSNEALLAYLVATPGIIAFLGRNRHHVRSRIYDSGTTHGLIDDLRADITRCLPVGAVGGEREIAFVAGLMFSAALDAIFAVGMKNLDDMRDALTIVNAMLVGGIEKLVGAVPPQS